MSIIKKIKKVLSMLFLPKKIPSEHIKKIRKKKKIRHVIHRKIRHTKKRVHRHVKKHVHKIRRHLKHRTIKKESTKKRVQIEEKPTPLPSKWFWPKKIEKEKTEKIIYGIPKHHKHEAELKVAEKSSDIEGEYAKQITDKRVQLKIQEKTTSEIFREKQGGRHFFFFKFKKRPERQEIQKKKIEEKKTIEKIEIKIDPKKRAAVKKILEIIKAKKQKNMIITNLDMLLEVINQLGSVRIDYIADALKLDEKKTEELANILENNNLIEIHYPALGKTEFKKIGGKNGQGTE